jgi:hypothetical protein
MFGTISATETWRGVAPLKTIPRFGGVWRGGKHVGCFFYPLHLYFKLHISPIMIRLFRWRISKLGNLLRNLLKKTFNQPNNF